MQLDVAEVKRDFERSASDYDEHAHMQKDTTEYAASLLGALCDADAQVLDVGAGTGYLSQYAQAQELDWNISQLDIAFNMCAEAYKVNPQVLNGSAMAIPCADRQFDAVFSSLCLQWVPDPQRALREFARVLKPDGRVLISTYGPNTLCEMREAFAGVDDAPHVIDFEPAENLLAMARHAGLICQLSKANLSTVQYPNLKALMRQLKGLGAANKHSDRQRGLMGLRRFANMEQAYEAKFMTQDGLPASWEVYYMVFSN